MNGRVYDPATAQFFSPDPFIQEAGNWQNYNRYSYVFNNPLIFTDPSGYRKKTFHELEMEYLSDYTPVRNTSYRYIKKAGTSGGGGLFNSYIDAQNKGYSGSYDNFIATIERRQRDNNYNGYISLPTATFAYSEIIRISDYYKDYLTIWNSHFTEIWVGSPIYNFSDINGGIGIIGAGTDIAENVWNKLSKSIKQHYAYELTKYLKQKNIIELKPKVPINGISSGFKYLGRATNYASVAVIVVDVTVNSQINASNILDATVTGLSFIPVVGWGIGLTYLGADLVTQGVTGRSIGDHLNNAVGKPLYDWDWN